MSHDAGPTHESAWNTTYPLLTTLAAGFGIALILGFIAERIKVPALVGYLVAGILIGPATPVFVADVHIRTGPGAAAAAGRCGAPLARRCSGCRLSSH